ECCLIVTKGKPSRISNKVSQLVVEPIQHHSKKPDVVREKIVELMGDLPRIELFARNTTDGWDVWGNEV
ncbi:MT-A70 family methyltransferase, partial [Pasteurella multocida]|uniref:MT-A70 family methyltransferase n=1 Tax=Pasteurella multocida TaxID=747 RepID=UPI0023E41CEB